MCCLTLNSGLLKHVERRQAPLNHVALLVKERERLFSGKRVPDMVARIHGLKDDENAGVALLFRSASIHVAAVESLGISAPGACFLKGAVGAHVVRDARVGARGAQIDRRADAGAVCAGQHAFEDAWQARFSAFNESRRLRVLCRIDGGGLTACELKRDEAEKRRRRNALHFRLPVRDGAHAQNSAGCVGRRQEMVGLQLKTPL